MWKAIEPTPNPNVDQLLPEGENYLNLVKQIIDVLYSYGLFEFSARYCTSSLWGRWFPRLCIAIDLFHGKPRTCKTKSWNYYLYNTEEYKDNWNLENFSLLGPTRIARHSEPVILFFDLKTKYGGVILKSPIVEYTIIYISDKIQYNRTFKVWIPGYN